MAQDWYYKLLGEETGPVSFAALRELAGDGHLASDDEVRTSTSSWKLAEYVPGLFEAGDQEEPELATDMDLDMLLAPSSSQPVQVSAKRQGQRAAIAAAAAPVAQWYYKLLGQEMGPTTTEEVIQQIKDGSLQGADLACLGANGTWQPLENTPEFSALVIEMRPKPEWFCRVLGQELGPMLFEELQQMAKSGALSVDDDVRHGLADPWTQADRRRGLKFSKKAAPVAMAAHDRTSTLIPFGAAATKREWYYEILGQMMGPISFNEMSKAFADGTLQMEDKARRGKAGAWSNVMDVPGIMSTDAKAAYLAAKIEASRPKPAPAPVVPQVKVEAPRTVAAPAPPSPVATPAPPAPSPSPPTSGYGGSASASGGYGSMASVGRPTVFPPATKAPKKSSGPSINVGEMFANLKDKIDAKALGAIAVILLVGVYFGSSYLGFSFGGQPGLAEYSQVDVLWSEVKQIHGKGDKPADWTQFTTEHKSEVKELLAQINKQNPGSARPLLQQMLLCTRDHLPKMMENSKDREARYKLMETAMKTSAKLAGGTSPADKPAAKPASKPATKTGNKKATKTESDE